MKLRGLPVLTFLLWLAGCGEAPQEPQRPDWVLQTRVVFVEADGKTPRAAPKEDLRLWMPFVVGANCFHGEQPYTAQEIAAALHLRNPDTPVLMLDARDRGAVRAVLLALLAWSLGAGVAPPGSRSARPWPSATPTPGRA